jgi:glycerophosphoryl diester phosphodiesterase
LAEVFALVHKSGNTHVRLNIETKIDPNHSDESPDPDKFVTILLKLVDKEKFAGRVIVQSFDWRTLVLVHQRAPSIPTVFLTQQMGEQANVFLDKPSAWTAGFDPKRYGKSVPAAIKAAGGAIWSPDYKDLDAALVAEAHSLGLQVVTWTVNDPKDMADLIDMGVDGIISDRPDVLRQIAGEKGVTLPKGTPVSP